MSRESEESRLIEKGILAGDTDMYNEDTIWSQNSSDKIDIAQELMRVIREIFGSVPVSRNLRALSIGSGPEPQFQILEAAFRGGLYLLDIDRVPLSVINRRIKSHFVDHVSTIKADYSKCLVTAEDAEVLLKDKLGGCRQNLIILHHSLYYLNESKWTELFGSLYDIVLADNGAIHAVMMSANCSETDSTTWLYNHFAGKYFGCVNDQNLLAFGKKLRETEKFRGALIRKETHRVKFFSDDFEKLMAVIWMILLYPCVHVYSSDQKKEITEYIYSNFFKPRKSLIQKQDHLVISR